jgi:hypothetical protein
MTLLSVASRAAASGRHRSGGARLLEDPLDAEERERLHAALEASEDDFAAGRVVPGDQVVARLRRGTA